MKKFDIIIPTYNRPLSTISNTLDSIYKAKEFDSLVNSIIVVDQNQEKLDISKDVKLKHILLDTPSLTNARNIGAQSAEADYLIYFDDDVIVNENILSSYMEVFKKEDPPYIAGREILKVDEEINKNRGLEAKIKNQIRRLFMADDDVAKISKNGFFFCDFSKKTNKLIKVDTVRGCNFAVKRDCLLAVEGFDTNYKKNALREETDFILRVREKYGDGYYYSKAEVLHLRQFGGCSNLDQSLQSLEDKYENELYFQIKFFKNTNPLLFFIRLLPLAIEHGRGSLYRSFKVLMKYTKKFKELKHSSL